MMLPLIPFDEYVRLRDAFAQAMNCIDGMIPELRPEVQKRLDDELLRATIICDTNRLPD